MPKISVIVLIVAAVALVGVLGYQKLIQPETTPIVVNQPVVNQPIVDNIGIKTGKFIIDYRKVDELQSAMDSGHQPWRGAADMVLKADGLGYGFTADELGKAKKVLLTAENTSGIVQYEVSHDGVVYIISLIQPPPTSGVGEAKIWMIFKISQK